jgi:hypothetical protein
VIQRAALWTLAALGIGLLCGLFFAGLVVAGLFFGASS